MALLTDGKPNTTESLRVYETEILNLANVEAIDLDAKLGLALDEISFEVLDILLDHSRAADPVASVRRVIGVSDVYVTPQLRRWHALHGLELIYRDAFNNQLNERYQRKWDEYRDLSREAREQAVHYGVGLVSSPVPRADAPTFSSVAGLIPATVYYARVSWTSGIGQEGSPSWVTSYETPNGSLLVVQPPQAPPGVTGWNVYLGITDASPIRQNAAPLALNEPFTIAASGLVSGVAPGDGQAADVWVIGGRSLRRG